MNPPEVRPEAGPHISKNPAPAPKTVDLTRSKPDTLQRIVRTHGGR